MRRSPRWTWTAASLVILLAGCSTPSARPEGGFDITVDPSLMRQSRAQSAAWLAYAVARIQAYDDLAPARHNKAGEDYLIELRARAALAGFWRDQQGKPDVPPDAYLDRLVELAGSGLLEEHVLASLFLPGWTIPAAELERIDLGALDQTPSRNETPTLATARPHSGRLASEIPGYGLPDPTLLDPSRVACTDSLPTLRKAVSSWEREQENLDGAPVSANSGTEFLALISAGLGKPPFRTRGATWVSPRAYLLLFIAGFCANELEDYPRAESWLESAMAMAPGAPQAPMELTHALVALRKFDRADAIIDDVLAATQDRCESARAWRRRGYIRFEQRRLDESRVAYQKSLEFDPYVPPASQTKLTVCPPG